MHIFLLTVLLTAVTASAREILSEYHQKVGIPLAKHIKATEDVVIRKRRVVGGDPVAITAHPYLAGLIISLYGNSDTSVCSATLLNQQLLVSAAHCNYDGKRTVRGYTVVLGSSMLYSGGLRIETSRVSVHPDFDLDLLLNDISIIHLPSKISYTKYIRPVSLPSARDKSKKFVGYAATVAGYGDIDENQDNSNPNSEANEVKLNVISNSICSHHYGGIIRMTELCTSGKGRIGTCYGDSGGPLVIKKHGKDILIGIASFTHIDGCERGKPSGFSRVTAYLDFLQEVMDSNAALYVTYKNSSANIYCGATLLNQQLLVTAAHCLKGDVKRITAVFGKESELNNGIIVPVSMYFIHPEWNPDGLVNDIAIVYLKNKINFTESIRPVTLPNEADLSETFAGHTATAVGYGSRGNNRTYWSNMTLNEVKLRVIPNWLCKLYYQDKFVPTNKLCTSGISGVGICPGDSGGPLVIKRDGKDILIGVVSFLLLNNCNAGYASGFTRVTEYYDFLREMINASELPFNRLSSIRNYKL